MSCEQEIEAKLQAQGWETLHKGWPDFLCWRTRPDGTREVMCVEVKDERTKDSLRPEQVINHAMLTAIGLPVYVVKNTEQLDGDDLSGTESMAVYSADMLRAFERKYTDFMEAMERCEADYKKAKEGAIEQFLERVTDKYDKRFEQADKFLTRFADMRTVLEAANTEFERNAGLKKKAEIPAPAPITPPAPTKEKHRAVPGEPPMHLASEQAAMRKRLEKGARLQ